MDGAGNSNSLLQYSLVDLQPYNGTSYYRLKQTDFNGTYVYSALAAVTFSGEAMGAVAAFPNPVSGEHISIRFDAAEGEALTIALYNASGVECSMQQVQAGQSGSNVFAITPARTLEPGIYLATVTSAAGVRSARVVVK
jgi:hypothetical protein